MLHFSMVPGHLPNPTWVESLFKGHLTSKLVVHGKKRIHIKAVNLAVNSRGGRSHAVHRMSVQIPAEITEITLNVSFH